MTRWLLPGPRSRTSRVESPAPLASPPADDLVCLARLTYRRAKRLVVLVVGSTLLLLGAALLILPGPGIPTLLLALAVLATEFLWARLLLRRTRIQTRRVIRVVRRILNGASPR